MVQDEVSILRQGLHLCNDIILDVARCAQKGNGSPVLVVLLDVCVKEVLDEFAEGWFPVLVTVLSTGPLFAVGLDYFLAVDCIIIASPGKSQYENNRSQFTILRLKKTAMANHSKDMITVSSLKCLSRKHSLYTSLSGAIKENRTIISHYSITVSLCNHSYLTCLSGLVHNPQACPDRPKELSQKDDAPPGTKKGWDGCSSWQNQKRYEAKLLN